MKPKRIYEILRNFSTFPGRFGVQWVLYHFITNNETDFKIEKVEWIYEKTVEYTFGCTLCGTFDWWMWNWMKGIFKKPESESGAAIIEFALGVPFLLIFAMAAMEFGVFHLTVVV